MPPFPAPEERDRQPAESITPQGSATSRPAVIATPTSNTQPPTPDAQRPFSFWDALPAAWMALCLFAYGVLVLNPVARDRSSLPGLLEAERLALPLLCLVGIAAIIRYFSLPHGQPRRSRPEQAEGQDTV